MAEIKIDLSTLMLQGKKTYIAVVTGTVMQILQYFGYGDPALVTTIGNVAWFMTLAFLGMKVDREKRELLGSIGAQEQSIVQVLESVGLVSAEPIPPEK